MGLEKVPGNGSVIGSDGRFKRGSVNCYDILIKNTGNSFLDVSGIQTYISTIKNFDSSMAETCSNMLESALLEIYVGHRTPSIDEFNKIDCLMTHPLFFKYDYQSLDIIETGKNHNLELVSGKFDYIHGEEVIELYSNISSNFNWDLVSMCANNPYDSDLFDNFLNHNFVKDDTINTTDSFVSHNDINENMFSRFLNVPIKSQNGLKMISGTEHKLHYHLKLKKNGKNQSYNVILTFDPLSDADLPSLYAVKHAKGKSQAIFRPGKFGMKTRREIYELAHKPILEERVKLEDFRSPSKKKRTLFYPC